MALGSAYNDGAGSIRVWQESAAAIRFCPSPLFPTIHIIGGGPSLKTWLPALERGLNSECVIAVNDAYQHFPDAAVKLHSDRPWFILHKDELDRLIKPMQIVVSLLHVKPWMPRMLWLARTVNTGLTRPNQIGNIALNGSTGAAAIHLALAAGARRVVLWGFDLKNSAETGEGNWHPNPLSEPGTAYRYGVFRKGFEAIAADLPKEYPDAVVMNAGPDSALPDSVFPHVDPKKAVLL